jgi:DNA-binding CsgD family transcriptional regulator
MARWSPVALPPRFVAARRTRLVGRRYELGVLETVWERVAQGAGQVLLIGGEPGAGKTRLAAETAGVLHEQGAAVLVGTATKDAGVPYQPFAEMLDHLFLASEPGTLDAAGELRLLSRHAARHLPDPAEPVGDGRRDLFEAVAELFRSIARDQPLVVVLDDLHWAQLPTVALLEHVVHSCLDTPTLVVATFRTTAPDRSDELSARLADLHRLDGVRRLDLAGLDTEAIAEFVCDHAGVSPSAARASAAILRDRTGGNPFFLRETWLDLERHGGVAALRGPQRVPATLGDTVAARLAGLGTHLRETVELAAVIGDGFDLPTLVGAGTADRSASMDAVDAAVAVGLVEPVAGTADRYGFVHSLTRQAVLDRLPHTRCTTLHARVAQTLEAHGDPALTPRIAHHYLAAHVLGFHEQALRHTAAAARQAAHSLAFEEAALWFDRAASLPETPEGVRAQLSFEAAANHVRAGDFARARGIYERLTTTTDPMVRLEAAMGLEEAVARPGLSDGRAADLLGAALAGSALAPDDPRHLRARGSLGRALAFAGRVEEARAVGSAAIEAARRSGDRPTLVHVLKTSLWHGLTPDVAAVQLARSTELARLCAETGDRESGSMASFFRVVVSYLAGRPDDLAEATTDLQRAAESLAQPWHAYFAGCVAQSRAFCRGDFAQAEQRAAATLQLGEAFGDDSIDGSHGVQMFMLHRETGRLDVARRHLTGRETFADRWVAGLLALYTELDVTEGVRRALRHLLDGNLAAHTTAAHWPVELAFLTEGALALGDREAALVLRPFLDFFAGKNLVGGQLVAVFGSADRYLARVAALLGDGEAAERHFAAALEMDRRMGSVVHIAETLAAHALAVQTTDPTRARALAAEARALAEPIGQVRVLRSLEQLARSSGPAQLTAREVEVLGLVAAGLSNREIAGRLFISTNTAANHIRSILMKTGTTNRTQAARYATEHELA